MNSREIRHILFPAGCAMKPAYSLWSMAAVLVVCGPVGLRVLSWKSNIDKPVDATMASAGAVLFNHEWQPYDPLCAGGDGLGPVFNAKSCVACHSQGGIGGGGVVEHNVTTFTATDPRGGQTRSGVVHSFATADKYRESLKHVDSLFLDVCRPKLEQVLGIGQGKLTVNNNGCNVVPPNVAVSQRNTPALFGAGLIDQIPDRVIVANERRQKLAFGLAPGDTESVPVGRAHRLPDGTIGKFGWQAQTADLAEFVQAACANELGLSNPGHAQPKSLAQPIYVSTGTDLTQMQCNELASFVAALPRPIERKPADAAEAVKASEGKALFAKVGCANCHVPNLGSVDGLYSDLLLHRMGSTLESGSGSYGRADPPPTSDGEKFSGPLADEWRTPPLWGVADSAPYMHDGRAATLQDAIALHAGQGASSLARYNSLAANDRAKVLAFLGTLRAP
jgi:CxxC motif-containing protein (DUF1111 family)